MEQGHEKVASIGDRKLADYIDRKLRSMLDDVLAAADAYRRGEIDAIEFEGLLQIHGRYWAEARRLLSRPGRELLALIRREERGVQVWDPTQPPGWWSDPDKRPRSIVDAVGRLTKKALRLRRSELIRTPPEWERTMRPFRPRNDAAGFIDHVLGPAWTNDALEAQEAWIEPLLDLWNAVPDSSRKRTRTVASRG